MPASVYIASAEPLKNETLFKQAYPLLSSQRRRRIAETKSLNSQIRLAAAELLLRQAMKEQGYFPDELRYTYNQDGKPYLADNPGLFFSLSHSGEYVMCVLSDSECGCDLQEDRMFRIAAAKRFFSHSEYQSILNAASDEEKKDLFFRYWTIRESWFKYLGTGIMKDIRAEVQIDEQGKISVLAEGFRQDCEIHEIRILKGYHCAVCVKTPPQIRMTHITFEETCGNRANDFPL